MSKTVMRLADGWALGVFGALFVSAIDTGVVFLALVAGGWDVRILQVWSALFVSQVIIQRFTNVMSYGGDR